MNTKRYLEEIIRKDKQIMIVKEFEDSPYTVVASMTHPSFEASDLHAALVKCYVYLETNKSY